MLRIRLAQACEDGGIPMESLAEAVRAGHLSLAFLELWPFERAAGAVQTYAELAEETDVPFPTLQRAVEAFGFARPEHSHVVAEGAGAVASLVGRALALGVVDEVTSIRLGHHHVESLRRIASVETDVYHANIEMPLLRSGAGERATMEQAGEIGVSLVGLLDEVVMATYRRRSSSRGPST
ncbi:MAG TPA: hypothetical protein VFZ96_06965 [Actinomycetota bacterium]|nr:hypothetical protein [Actinomycetota bacterium]